MLSSWQSITPQFWTSNVENDVTCDFLSSDRLTTSFVELSASLASSSSSSNVSLFMSLNVPLSLNISFKLSSEKIPASSSNLFPVLLFDLLSSVSESESSLKLKIHFKISCLIMKTWGGFMGRGCRKVSRAVPSQTIWSKHGPSHRGEIKMNKTNSWVCGDRVSIDR